MPIDACALDTLLAEAVTVADTTYTAADAQRWGDNFSFAPTTVSNNEAALRHHGSFTALVQATQARLRPDRLNHERVDALHLDNPERERLHALVGGMEIIPPAGFVANGASDPPRLRRLYEQTHAAIDRMVDGLVQQGLALVLPRATAIGIPGLHLSLAHWAPKQGKPSGRYILDPSDPTCGALNSDDVRLAVEERWGPIRHPSIGELVRMVLDYHDARCVVEPNLTWDDFVLFKMDLKGAFNLLFVAPDSAQRTAHELVGGLVVIFLCAVFGWTGTPFAFQTVTRALVFELTFALIGAALMYCDDIMAITLRRDADNDIAAARATCTALLGPDAVEDRKTETSDDGGAQRQDWIGYTVSLRTLTVTERDGSILLTP